MSARARLAFIVLIVAASAPPAHAQLSGIAVRPEVGMVAPSRFYSGPISRGYPGGERGAGTVRLEPALAWGAHVRIGSGASPWRFAFTAATATTWSVARGVIDSAGNPTTRYRTRTPARLTMLALGVERPLRPHAARLAVVGRLGASIASVTFEPRRFPPPPHTQETIALYDEQLEKPWNRRYVSPGVDIGLDASWRVAGRIALTAGASLASVRNETGDMAAGGRSEGTTLNERRETYWMMVPRLSLGFAIRR